MAAGCQIVNPTRYKPCLGGQYVTGKRFLAFHCWKQETSRSSNTTLYVLQLFLKSVLYLMLV